MKQSFATLENKSCVEKDITSLDSLNYTGAEKLAHVFKSSPEVDPDSPHSCQAVETWQSLKPITLYQIIKNSENDELSNFEIFIFEMCIYA